MDVREALAGTGLFAAADDVELSRLSAVAGSRRIARGQLLFAEGDPSEHLYLVVTGRLKVLLVSPRGDELVLSVVGPGDVLGELSVLDGQPRSASTQALEDTTLVAVPSAAVREVLASSPGLALAWAQEVCGTVRRLTGSTADLVFLDLPRRLAKLLLDSGEGAEVDLGMSQSEVAARLGVTRQSLNRALSSLQQRGWLRVEGSRVALTERAALERFAGS